MKIEIALLALLAVGACKDKGEESASGETTKGTKAGDTSAKAGDTSAKAGATSAKAGATSAKASPASPMKLDKFELTMDVPAGTKLGEIGDRQLLKGPDLLVTVNETGQFSPENVAMEVDEAKQTYDDATNFAQEEVEGGWHVTFEEKDGSDTNYYVKSHVTVGDNTYVCGTTCSSAKLQANALAACKSLK